MLFTFEHYITEMKYVVVIVCRGEYVTTERIRCTIFSLLYRLIIAGCEFVFLLQQEIV